MFDGNGVIPLYACRIPARNGSPELYVEFFQGVSGIPTVLGVRRTVDFSIRLPDEITTWSLVFRGHPANSTEIVTSWLRRRGFPQRVLRLIPSRHGADTEIPCQILGEFREGA
jgi:hypothetical protein